MTSDIQSYIKHLVNFSQLPKDIINIINLNPDFNDIDGLRIKDITSYFQDNDLIQYIKWTNSIVFYFANQIIDIDITEDECAICLEEVNDNNYAVLECNHFFHYKCIRQWKKKRNACPKCNGLIIYKCITLPRRLRNNIDELINKFNIIEDTRHQCNKKWFTIKNPPFNQCYILYQLIKHIKITLSSAEDHCILDNINKLNRADIMRQDATWGKICAILNWKYRVIICIKS